MGEGRGGGALAIGSVYLTLISALIQFRHSIGIYSTQIHHMKTYRRQNQGIIGFSWIFLCLISGNMDAQVSTNMLTMDNAAILYSPFNWGVTSRSAKTINSGAYFKVLFGGTSCSLALDTSSNTAPFSQFWARVDGGPFTQYTLSRSNLMMSVATGLTKRKHLLEVVVKSTSETIERWTKQRTAVVFTGIWLDNGAILSAPVRKPFNILIYGDSITEGVRVNGYSGITYDTDRNDALQVYSWLLSQELPAEVGVVGFGATGINTSGSGGVPNLGKSYAYLWAGEPRSFSDPEPDLILYNEGTNDGGSITSGMVAVVQALLRAAPNARQLLLLPFNGSHASELKAVVTAVGSSRVSFGDTKGFFNPLDSSDSLHPYGYANLAFIAPKMASLVTPLLILAPKGLRASVSNQIITLSWSTLVGATNYNVYRGTNSGGPYSWIGSSTTTNYMDNISTGPTTYFYVISAALRTGETGSSGEVSATPQSPLRLQAYLLADGSQIALSWPGWASNFNLFGANNLTEPIVWEGISGTPQVSNDVFSLSLPVMQEGQQFYQLKAQ
jgi:hypothetical protein